MTKAQMIKKKLSLDEIRDFIRQEHLRMVKKWGKESNQKERTLARTIKLMEELGELCNEILSFNTGQRKLKMKAKDTKKLEEEFADVLIVTFLLAENTKIDIFDGLKRKIDLIKKRWRNNEY